jgi:hypothetical protein
MALWWGFSNTLIAPSFRCVSIVITPIAPSFRRLPIVMLTQFLQHDRTLDYATRTRDIKNKPVVHSDEKDGLMISLRRDLQNMMQYNGTFGVCNVTTYLPAYLLLFVVIRYPRLLCLILFARSGMLQEKVRSMGVDVPTAPVLSTRMEMVRFVYVLGT